ncbi:MAG: hypothetical protein ACI4WW_04290 [Candidatus Coprovivens sp.]
MEETIDYLVIDNKRYAILNEIEDKGNKYVLFANLDDVNDICVRKVVVDEEDDYIVGLDNQEEFDRVMLLFSKELR